MRSRNSLGNRKHARVDFSRSGFVILEPGGPWIECYIQDVSEGGACIDVGALACPTIFMLLLSPRGEVRRVCKNVWRRGELVGVKFLKAKDCGEVLSL
jgi:PilZ domain-containing protein